MLIFFKKIAYPPLFYLNPLPVYFFLLFLILLSVNQFYEPGDRVQLGGITGDVIDISILRTTVMEIGGWVKADLYNGRIVRIANSFIFKEPVYNYSADFPFVWDEIVLPIKYGCGHRLAREILYRVADEVVGDMWNRHNLHGVRWCVSI